MQTFYEILPFVLSAVISLLSLLFMLDKDSRQKSIPLILFTLLFIMFICIEIIKNEKNTRQIQNDSMRPVVEKLDEILNLMKSQPKAMRPSLDIPSEKNEKSNDSEEKSEKESFMENSSVSPSLDDGQPGRLASAEKELERLKKKKKNEKKKSRELTVRQNEDRKLHSSLSAAPPQKRTSSKPVKTPKRAKPAFIPKAAAPSAQAYQPLVQSQPASAGREPVSRLCLHGKKATHITSIQTMIKLLRISKTGEQADFDITPPNSYVRHIANMKEGTRRPFESNRKTYFFELVQLQTGCADVAVNERRMSNEKTDPQVSIQ